jgi:cytochrome c-type biogenesis protein CcmH
MKGVFALLVFVCTTGSSFAVGADETFLANPQQEQQARTIMRDLRCLVCRNESLVDSHADLARDLRSVVRERVAAGDTPAQVRQYMVDRYGEWILLQPAFTGLNIVLWTVPFALLALGGVTLYRRGKNWQDADTMPDRTQ